MSPEAGAEFYERTGASTALDVNQIRVGEPRTIVPAVARAHLTSVRLAAGQSAAAIGAELERLLREAAHAGAEVSIEIELAEPGRLRPLAPGASARRTGDGARLRHPRRCSCAPGGTIPVLAELAARGIDAVVTGFALPTTTPSTRRTRAIASRASGSARPSPASSTWRWRTCPQLTAALSAAAR